MATINQLAHLNLNQNELQNAVIQNIAVAPENPLAGQLWFDTVSNHLKAYDGTRWISTTEIPEVVQQKDYSPEITQALVDAKAYADELVKNNKAPEINFAQEIANVLRAQDPTVNGLVKQLSQLTEDEKRQITDPVKQELLQLITQKIDEVIGGSSEDLNTLKELADAIEKFGDISEAIKNLPKKEIYTLGNESSGIHSVSHTRNTEDVVVSVYNTTKQQVITDVQVVDANTVNIIVRQGVNLTGYKVVIVG